MNTKVLITTVCVGAIAVALLPMDLVAGTASSGDFATADFTAQSTKIKEFLFGPLLRIAGVLGGGYGVIRAVMTSSPSPLLVYGGLGLGANLVPKFIDSVFVSGMLLP